MKNQLLTEIHDHNAAVAVIGLGYVGLPLSVALRSGGERLPRHIRLRSRSPGRLRQGCRRRYRRRPQQSGRDP